MTGAVLAPERHPASLLTFRAYRSQILIGLGDHMGKIGQGSTYIADRRGGARRGIGGAGSFRLGDGAQRGKPHNGDQKEDSADHAAQFRKVRPATDVHAHLATPRINNPRISNPNLATPKMATLKDIP